jgi:hypothetical protein
MKHTFFTIAGALLAGFVGGVLGVRFSAATEQQPARNIRARSFELVDEKGEAIAFWGVDQQNSALLAFGARGNNPHGLKPRSPGGLANPQNQLALFGVDGGDGGILQINGSDGHDRARLKLDVFGQPSLEMSDEITGRMSLGIVHTDTPVDERTYNWALGFYDRVGYEAAGLGMFVEKEKGKSYLRGSLFTNPRRLEFK